MGNPETADENTVEEARAAYDALTPEQKTMVANYETLTIAETTIAERNTQVSAPKLSAGAIAGIVIGCFFGLLLIACAVLFILHKKGKINIPFLKK